MTKREMRRQVLQRLVQCGILIEPEALEHVLRQPEPLSYVEQVLGRLGQMPLHLTMSHMTSPNSAEEAHGGHAAERSAGARAAQTVIPPSEDQDGSRSNYNLFGGGASKHHRPRGSGYRDGDARECEPMIDILCSAAEGVRCSGDVTDFKRYFNSRFELLSKVLREKPELASTMDIEVARRYEREVAVVGVVSEVRIARDRGRYTILRLEDTTGEITVLIADPKDYVLTDEVIGVTGTVKRGRTGEHTLFAERIVHPGVQMRQPRLSSRPLSVALISDIHVGSRYFMPEAWGKFMRWLKSDDPLAKRLKYLLIAGDLVDGIGIFPSQEEELEMHDIHHQYQALAALLDEIPEHVEVLLIPGNHDAVRLSEPQPPLARELRGVIGERFHFLGNPSLIALDGVRVLGYHGKGIDDFVGRVGTLGYTQPAEIMAEMLKRRHLCPVYGGKTQIMPTGTDHLAISQVPEIFVTGHIHTSAVGHYRGVMTISASAWQSQTPYQVTRNIRPDPGKVVVVDLDTLAHEVRVFA
ncbi:MAG: DNA-directed DNA polymerase II small subunit [Candidatus Thermoplasmatota archaeon]